MTDETMTDNSLNGAIVHYESFPSDLVEPRPVDVWLPEGYDAPANDRYPVIYMHDGQYLFDHATSPYAGTKWLWDVDKTMMRLIREEEIRPAIVVAV
jgi:enterochelin esterase-like enzyme